MIIFSNLTVTKIDFRINKNIFQVKDGLKKVEKMKKKMKKEKNSITVTNHPNNPKGKLFVFVLNI